MTARESDRPRLLTRAFWAMMALALLSFLAAAAVTTFASRPAATPRPPAHAPPLAGGAMGAKRAAPQPSLGPP